MLSSWLYASHVAHPSHGWTHLIFTKGLWDDSMITLLYILSLSHSSGSGLNFTSSQVLPLPHQLEWFFYLSVPHSAMYSFLQKLQFILKFLLHDYSLSSITSFWKGFDKFVFIFAECLAEILTQRIGSVNVYWTNTHINMGKRRKEFNNSLKNRVMNKEQRATILLCLQMRE